MNEDLETDESYSYTPEVYDQINEDIPQICPECNALSEYGPDCEECGINFDAVDKDFPCAWPGDKAREEAKTDIEAQAARNEAETEEMFDSGRFNG